VLPKAIRICFAGRFAFAFAFAFWINLVYFARLCNEPNRRYANHMLLWCDA